MNIKFKDMEKGKFTLQHTVLYAKGWYKKSGDLFEDMKKCLTADGYSGDIMGKADVLNVIVRQFERLDTHYNRDLLTVLLGVTEHECWKVGYYTKNHAWAQRDGEERPEYDYYTAIVMYCLSSFLSIDKEQWEPVRPDFKNVLPAKNKHAKTHARVFFPTTKKNKKS